MAYNGEYLIKVGSSIIPNTYIVEDTYKCTPDQRQDVDSYRDLNQDLHRNVAEHYKSIVVFETRACLSETRLRTLINLIHSNFLSERERKVHLEYFNTDTGNYSSGDFYWVQPEYQIMKIDHNEIFYNSMEIKFIEY
jgi:hypothetical protein